MAIDPPATIAVLGAGPIGLEAALYGRFLGYTVDVYERSTVGANLLEVGHVRLFSPFHMNSSTLGLAALQSQDPAWRAPEPERLLLARELVTAYLSPLAASDLLAESLHEYTTVTAVGRQGLLKGEQIGDLSRGDRPFLLLLRDRAGDERTSMAQVVIDATGTYGNPNSLGDGGIPAIGEVAAHDRIDHGLPDILGGARGIYAGAHTLVVGAGYSAATNVAALAQLAGETDGAQITWVTRNKTADGDTGPIARISDDRLPERDRVAQAANALTGGGCPNLRHFGGTVVSRLEAGGARVQVHLIGEHEGAIEVDRILANVGFRPDERLLGELQVHLCYATGGPMKLAAALLGETSADCLDQSGRGTSALSNPEPNLYVLGAKSYGRNSKFLISVGLEQVRDVYTMITGRGDLNLYGAIRTAGSPTD